MKNSWHGEVWRLFGLVVICLIISSLSDHWGITFATGFALYGGHNLIQLYRLQRWLAGGARKSQVPDTYGIWEDIIGYVYRTRENSRKRKARLVSMLSRFNKSTEAIPDAAVVLRSNGEIEWANTAARRVLGIRNPQDIGQRIDNLMRSPEFRNYLGKSDFSSSIDICSPVYEAMELSVRVIEYGDGLRLLLAHDVTADNRLQQVRRDFVANVSHELKTPLTVVLGYTESLRCEDGLAEPVARGLESVDRQARRMSRIVDDLLMLSKMELDTAVETEVERVNVSSMLNALQEDIDLMTSTTHHKVRVVSDTGLEILGNFKELSSAFFNLIINAVQHTPPGTEVDVVWRLQQGAPCLTVSDNGPGIPAQHLPRITERFYRVDAGRSRESGGTGLGLAIVKHALENNDGRLSVESEPGVGTRFTCLFASDRIARAANAAM